MALNVQIIWNQCLFSSIVVQVSRKASIQFAVDKRLQLYQEDVPNKCIFKKKFILLVKHNNDNNLKGLIYVLYIMYILFVNVK